MPESLSASVVLSYLHDFVNPAKKLIYVLKRVHCLAETVINRYGEHNWMQRNSSTKSVFMCSEKKGFMAHSRGRRFIARMLPSAPKAHLLPVICTRKGLTLEMGGTSQVSQITIKPGFSICSGVAVGIGLRTGHFESAVSSLQ